LHPVDVIGQGASLDPAGPSQPNRVALDRSDEAGAGDRVHVVGGSDRVSGGSQNGAGEGMFTARFERRSDGKYLGA